MTTKNEILCSQIFEAIADRLVERRLDVEQFVLSEKSFEEWINWEAYGACRGKSWEAEPKPKYAKLGAADAGDLAADLSVTLGDTTVVLEVKIAHDCSGTKVLKGMNADWGKLHKLPDGKQGLQVIVVGSSKPIDNSKEWVDWLAKIEWEEATEMKRTIPFETGGELQIRAWAI